MSIRVPQGRHPFVTPVCNLAKRGRHPQLQEVTWSAPFTSDCLYCIREQLDIEIRTQAGGRHLIQNLRNIGVCGVPIAFSSSRAKLPTKSVTNGCESATLGVVCLFVSQPCYDIKTGITTLHPRSLRSSSRPPNWCVELKDGGQEPFQGPRN